MTSEEVLDKVAQMIFYSTDLYPEDARALAEKILDMLEENELLR